MNSTTLGTKNAIERMKRTVGQLCARPRTIGDAESLWAASARISRLLRAAVGDAPGVRLCSQSYAAMGAKYRNIIVKLGPPPGPGRLLTIVGAHYDAYPGSPGADDNASSVAVLVELTGLLAPMAERLERPIELAFWACEEPPAFGNGAMGSEHHAASLRNRGVAIGEVVILEMVGYYSASQGCRNLPCTVDSIGPTTAILPSQGDFLLINGTDEPAVGAASAAIERSGLKTVRLAAYTELLDWCDGVNWQNTPRLLLTDTGMLRNPNYHRSGDLPTTLDYRRMATLSKGLTSYLAGGEARNGMGEAR